MAVPVQTPYIEYTANGIAKSFALEFNCENQDHLIVLVDEVEPVAGTWSLSGGAVVFGTTPASGKKITIQRNTPFRRDEDFQSYDNSFRPPGVNNGFDKIWLKLQELGVADWILSNRIDALKSHVNQQDGILQDNIDSLKNYVDDKDDELRNYLLNVIQEQGVALDQLEEYYSYLMQQLAQVAIDRGWAASFIVSADGSTQQEINDFGGAKWWDRPLGYKLGATVKLMNGDIVKSTEPNNTKNPNIDMTGWVKTNDARHIFDASGESQQEINNKLQSGRMYFSQFGAKTIEQALNFDCTPIFLLAMYACAQAKKQLCINVPGTYRVNAADVKSSLVGAVELTSDFNNLTVIGEGDIIIKAIGSNDDFFSMFKIVDAKNIEFQNITFDGNGSKYYSSTNSNQFENGYSAFNIRSNSDDAVDNILFYNCVFKNTAESGITSWGSGGVPLPHYFSNRVQFLFCHFENIGGHGVGMNEFRNSNVSTCTFKNIGMKRLNGASGSGYAVDVSGGCEDVTVSSCTVDGSGGGFKAETHTYGAVDQAAKRISFLNNHIKNLWPNNRYPNEDFYAQYPAYRLNGVGCEIIGGTIDAQGNGILFSGKAKDCSATGVTIFRTQAANSDGIFFENASDVYGNNSANNNTIQNAARNGINLQGARNTASGNKVSGCGVGGIHVNYARNANVKNNECFDNIGYGVRVSKKTERASLVGNTCYDSRKTGKTQTTGIAVSTVYDDASEIQVQSNDCYDNAVSDYSMSPINTYSVNHLGFKEVYSGVVPVGGLWKNSYRVMQSFYGIGRVKSWVCSVSGGANQGILPNSTAISGGWYQWETGTTVWEMIVPGTTAVAAPSIAGKVVGDTVVHGTATLTLRALTTAAFVSEGVYA